MVKKLFSVFLRNFIFDTSDDDFLNSASGEFLCRYFARKVRISMITVYQIRRNSPCKFVDDMTNVFSSYSIEQAYVNI